jgi:hypothetical protein
VLAVTPAASSSSIRSWNVVEGVEPLSAEAVGHAQAVGLFDGAPGRRLECRRPHVRKVQASIAAS